MYYLMHVMTILGYQLTISEINYNPEMEDTPVTPILSREDTPLIWATLSAGI